MSKTLAEWMTDPTTRQGDVFTPSDGIDKRRAIVNGWSCLVILTDAEEDLEVGEESEVSHVGLADFRLQWDRQPMDLRYLTAQEALDRGVVVLSTPIPTGLKSQPMSRFDIQHGRERISPTPRVEQCGAPTGTHGRDECDNYLPCPIHGRGYKCPLQSDNCKAADCPQHGFTP